jgi:hypothetical protein
MSSLSPIFFLGNRYESFYGNRQNACRTNVVGKIAKTIQSKEDEKSLALRTHCQTSGWSLTEQDPLIMWLELPSEAAWLRHLELVEHTPTP